MVSSGEEAEKAKKRKKKSGKHRKKRRRSSSSDSSSSDSDSRKRKHKKKSKKSKSKRKRSVDFIEKRADPIDFPSIFGNISTDSSAKSFLPAIPEVGESAVVVASEPAVKPKGPMTKEQWDKQQNTLRRVFDADSGRTRLIRGDGEIMEEIVSRERHIAINKAATRADGAYYETVLGLRKAK